MGKSTGKHMSNMKAYNGYKAKHMKVVARKKIDKRIIRQIGLMILLSTISITTAYLITTNTLTNAFIIGKIEPEIVEIFKVNEKVKEDVQFKNSGNVPIYVRAAIVISWKDANGTTIEIEPIENVDYSINFSTSENWLYSDDGYYYYKNPVDVDEVTDILIDKCVQQEEYEDRILEVSIAVQAIQAEPTKAVQEAWNIETENDSLVI